MSDFDHSIITVSAEFNERQAAFFGQFSIRGRLKYRDHIEKYLSSLPDQFSYEELENIARKDAEENTTNNDLGMDNHFYNTQLKKDLKKWEGYQKKLQLPPVKGIQ